MSKKKTGTATPQDEHWLSVVDVFKANYPVSWTTTKEIQFLVKFINDEHEHHINTSEDTSNPLLIVVPPFGELGRTVQKENTWKFLTSLEANKIISELYLPVHVRKKNQDVAEFKQGSFYFNAEASFADAMRDFEKFKNKVVNFKVTNWEKFGQVKDKVNSSKQDLALDKGNGETIVIEPTDLDVALAQLCESALPHKASPYDWIKGDISLGPVEKEIKDEESQQMLNVVNFLQAQGVISKYEIIKRPDIIFIKKRGEETKELSFPTFVARCDFQPREVLELAKRQWEPKKQFAQQVSNLYFKMIKLVESYLVNPQILDAKLNNLYLQLDKQIVELLDQNQIPYLHRQYQRPFANLFSAQKEIEATKADLQSYIHDMYSFYGEIQNSVSSYSLEEKQDIIKELDSMLADIKEQKQSTPSTNDNYTEIPKEQSTVIDKVKVYISTDYGIYLDKENKTPNYPVSGKRARLVQFLNNRKLSALELCQLLSYSNESLLSKEIDSINSHFRKNLKQRDDLVTHLPAGGYTLNMEKYNIQILEK